MIGLRLWCLFLQSLSFLKLILCCSTGAIHITSSMRFGRFLRTINRQSADSSCFCMLRPNRISQLTGNHYSRDVATFAQINDDDSFYQKLGSPKHILAPMVAQSDLAFRLMCEQLYDVDLSYTQMIHAYNFVESNGETFRRHHLDVYPHSLLRDVLLGKSNRCDILPSKAQLNALQGLSESDIDASRRRILDALDKSGRKSFAMKPTVVQIAAHDPQVATEAALLILERTMSLDRSGSFGIDGSNVAPIAAIDLNLGKCVF